MGSLPQPEATWLRVAEAAVFERISRQEVYRRTKPGDPRFLVSKAREDGKPGRLIHARSMTPEAQERWRNALLKKVGELMPTAVQSGQLGLYEQTAVDRQVEALSIPPSERPVAFRRFRLGAFFVNGNWKAEGFPSKRRCMKVVAEREQISFRQLQRFTSIVKNGGGPQDLVRERPGPPPGAGTILDADMQAQLRGWHVIDNLNATQCHSKLAKYLSDKQNSPGWRVAHVYPSPPSYQTVARFLRSLDALDHAARQGPDALKAACGYIDRTYRDIRSLDRVENDEWKCDFFCYLANRPKVVKRFWLLTFYDERSMFPLVWNLVEGDKFDNRHGITEGDEIDLLVRLLRAFGVPRALVSDRGRFRGGTFGGNDRFKNADGILDRLGIAHQTPRDKNPRGARLERFHRFLADCSREMPGWIGSNDKEREMTPGDAQAAIHQRWVAGDHTVLASPLLSTEQASLKIAEWMERWRDHESQGTDMDGLSPRAVFQHNIPPGGLRRLTDAEIDTATAEPFPNQFIREGGIIQLRDGKRYSHPQLQTIQREYRDVTRSRWNHEFIVVHPSAKGEEVVIAHKRIRAGLNDPDQLSRQSELQATIRRKVGDMVQPMEYEPGAQFQAPPIALKPPDHEISSSEWLMDHNRYQHRKDREAWDFADLEK